MYRIDVLLKQEKQTKETMVANKLVALIDRFEKHHAIAGRDAYDIHYFLSFEKFNAIRKTLKTETLILITDEIKRIS